jgi:peptidyl-prolyl cis-trans isomerase C
MKRFWLGAVSVASMAILSACGEGDAEPTGQVVATVDGEEITQADLAAELSTVPGGNENPQLRDQAIQALVNRALLAAEAKRNGMDEGPAAAIAQRRLEQVALIDRLQGEARSQVPVPSPTEAQNYVTQNPASFAQRRIFIVDQYIARDVTPEVQQAMLPLNTMEQVAGLLQQRGVKFQRAVGVIDGLTADPALVKQIAALPPGEIFVVPEGQVVRINRIRDTVVEPVSGQDALGVARERLTAERREQAVRERMENVISTNSGNVRYNPEFAPKAAPKDAGKAATPAAPAAK